MISESEQTRTGDGGATSGPGVEMEPPKKPQVNRRLQFTLAVIIVLLPVMLLSGGIVVYRITDAISELRQELKDGKDAISMLQWRVGDLARKQNDTQDVINALQWRQDDLERKLKDARDSISILQSRQDDLERKLKDARDSISILQLRLDDLDRQQKDDEMKALLR